MANSLAYLALTVCLEDDELRLVACSLSLPAPGDQFATMKGFNGLREE